MDSTRPAVAAVPGAQRRPAAWTALAVGLTCLAALWATSPLLPLAWDEGNAIVRADGVLRWFTRWLPGGPEPGPFSREAIRGDWIYTTQIEGHPALYGLLIALGRGIGGSWLGPLESARLGPMLLFALATGALCYRLARMYGLTAGWCGAAALVLLPRMFAHAHFATLDGPLTSCWILAWATFTPGGRRGWSVWWGLALGLTLSAKATGWLAPLPFLAWLAVERRWSMARSLGVGMAIALATFLLLNPPLWHAPREGMAAFVDLTLHRRAHGLNISTLFLGRMYNLDFPLPWYNTFAWTAIAVPAGTLLLAAVGLVAAARRARSDPAGMLIAANWLVLLVARAIPGTPVHDGIRLFLPSFAFLAALAGMGGQTLLNRAGTALQTSPQPTGTPAPGQAGHWRRRAVLTLLIAIHAGSLSSVVWYAPQWLSHYNLLIGGLPGAAAAGMEPTYYWDALDGETLAWLHAHTPADKAIAFSAISAENLRLLKAWGRLRRAYEGSRVEQFRWYVLQHRPSGCFPADLWLLQRSRPRYVKTVRRGGWGPWRLDTPLLSVYPIEDYVRARRATLPRVDKSRRAAGSQPGSLL